MTLSWAIWLGIGIFLLIAEMLTLTFYVLWLGIGALVAGGVALVFPESFAAQAISGALVALILTFFTKRLTRLVRQSKGYRDPVDDLVGKQGIVQEAIADGVFGIVKVNGDTWSAVSSQTLEQGETVVIVARRSTILEVEKRGG